MLTGDSVAFVLHALATGFPDRAANVVAMSNELDETERAVLWAALTSSDDRSDQARRFGDALRSLGAPRASVNEAYRTAFYSGEASEALSGNPSLAHNAANEGGSPLDKWVHSFPIFDRHLAAYRGSATRALEIGVYRGGGLEMLGHYLGPAAQIVGVDIDGSARMSAEGRIIEIGDQDDDAAFLSSVAERHGPFDIVIDDGGHTVRQQIRSVETLFPLLTDGGIYMVEDGDTSYSAPYADPSNQEATFVAWVKDRIDDLHAHHHSTELDPATPWQTDLGAVHAYDSVVVLDKARRQAPFSEVSGTCDYINLGRDASAANVELLAIRQVALDQARLAEEGASRRIEDAERRLAEVVAKGTEAEEASLDEVRTLRAELVAAGQNASRTRAELDSTREELEDASSKLLGSWEILREMRQSRSWQVTAPLRGAKSLIRRR